MGHGDFAIGSRTWPGRLEDELADLEAAIAFVLEHNDLDAGRVAGRRAAKLRQFRGWHREQGGGAAGAVY